MNYYQLDIPDHGVVRLGHPAQSETIPPQPAASSWAIDTANWVSSVEGMYFLSQTDMTISTDPLGGSSFVQCDNHVMCAGGSYSRIALSSISDEVAGGEEEIIKNVDGYVTLGPHQEQVTGDRDETALDDIHISTLTIMNEKAAGDITYEIGDFSMTMALQTFVMTQGNATEILHPALEPINPVEAMPKLDFTFKFGPAVEITNSESFGQFEGIKLVLNFTDCNYFFLGLLNNESKLIVGSALVEIIKGNTNKIVMGSSVKFPLLYELQTEQVKSMEAAKIQLQASYNEKFKEMLSTRLVALGVYGKKSENM